MVKSMVAALFRKPASRILLGILVAVVLLSGGVLLVNEELRTEVQGRVMSVLPGTVVNGCEIKMYAVCPNADLRGADLRGVNLSGSNLRDANLDGADLSGANLTQVDWSGASLNGAKLVNAKLRWCWLRGISLN
ncbi:MAG: pentapeptide repeat-containing protein, partial [Chloroflexota bacterium]